jgi:hypothetical protein
MRGKQTIIMNGKLYDAVSGLPMAAPNAIARPVALKPKSHQVFSDIGPSVSAGTVRPVQKPHHPAATVHRSVQKSQTLRREVLKRPSAGRQESLRNKPAAGHVPRSNMISKFAPHPVKLQPTATAAGRRTEAGGTPIVAKPAAATVKAAEPKQAKLSSREHKEKLIAERLASIDHNKRAAKPHRTHRSFFGIQPPVSSIVVSCVALILLGGYLTYLNMPNLSVRVAAAQSGVAASFPQYHPDGYRFDGPIAYSPGEVAINFASNGGPQKFTIKQKSSGWDSQAVLDNYVAKKSNNQYITSSENGLTIYTFDNKAAWVNRGIFYSIDGDAPLSSDQVLRIAASM